MRVLSFLLCVFLLAGCKPGRQQIRAVGSSTVFPFSAMAAERFGEVTDFRTPIVEENGTGGGIALFCEGVGARTPADIANASRPMKKSERARCVKHGVRDITELALGYDGIVVAEAAGNTPTDLNLRQLFLALMKDVPRDGKLVANPYHRWREIDPALPDRPIEVYGPPPSSGTRDTLVDIVSEAGCGLPEYQAAYADEKARKAACRQIRGDGPYIEGREDDNIVVLKLTSNPNAFGIFGYSYLEQNEGKVRGARIDGVAPSEKAIRDGKYKLARVLYAYVKGENIGVIPGLGEFARELVSDDAVGPEGYLTAAGLIPLPKEKASEARASAHRMNPLPGGESGISR